MSMRRARGRTSARRQIFVQEAQRSELDLLRWGWSREHDPATASVVVWGALPAAHGDLQTDQGEEP